MIKGAFLAVDDEAIILMALKRELSLKFGDRFRVETALSAEEGLELIEELARDGVEVILVISDWLMPGMKGDEFLISAKRANPTIRTIMITGHADAAAIERARREAGLIACFSKPWSAKELESAIERALAS
jgi:DNA-binding NtrC family response regulator